MKKIINLTILLFTVTNFCLAQDSPETEEIIKYRSEERRVGKEC